MGHGADPARAALGLRRALLFALAFLAACGPAPATDPGGPETLVVLAITGLRMDDPFLGSLPESVAPGTEALASGTGAGAVLELLDGRTALQHLRAPMDPFAWAPDLTTRIDIMDPALRSEPEWVHSGARWSFSEVLPEVAPVDIHVIVVQREQISDEELGRYLDRDGATVIAGIPTRPSPREDAETVLARFRVPVITTGESSVASANARTPGDVLAPLRGEVRRPAPRVALWWHDQGGGVVVEQPGAWVIGGSGRTPVAVGDREGVEPAAIVDAALDPGSLLVLVRGSEGADLVGIELLTGRDAEWSPWGLEPIDTAQQTSPRYLRLDLAAEPESDGIVVADAHTQKIDILAAVEFGDAPLIGTPIRDAVSGHGLGVDSIRIAPWSRNYWRLTRRTTFDAATWWPTAGAGIHLLWVHEGTGPPAPVLFED